MYLHDQCQQSPASCDVPPVTFNSRMQVCRDETETALRKQGHQDNSHGQSPVSIWQPRVLHCVTARSFVAALYQYAFMSAKTTVTMAKMMGNLTCVHPSYPSSFRLHTIKVAPGERNSLNGEWPRRATTPGQRPTFAPGRRSSRALPQICETNYEKALSMNLTAAVLARVQVDAATCEIL